MLEPFEQVDDGIFAFILIPQVLHANAEQKRRIAIEQQTNTGRVTILSIGQDEFLVGGWDLGFWT
ncbi:MAG: hypothetical protein ACOJUL_08685 [Candidatus Pollutiaquabacter aromativorans]